MITPSGDHVMLCIYHDNRPMTVRQMNARKCLHKNGENKACRHMQPIVSHSYWKQLDQEEKDRQNYRQRRRNLKQNSAKAAEDLMTTIDDEYVEEYGSAED